MYSVYIYIYRCVYVCWPWQFPLWMALSKFGSRQTVTSIGAHLCPFAWEIAENRRDPNHTNFLAPFPSRLLYLHWIRQVTTDFRPRQFVTKWKVFHRVPSTKNGYGLSQMWDYTFKSTSEWLAAGPFWKDKPSAGHFQVIFTADAWRWQKLTAVAREKIPPQQPIGLQWKCLGWAENDLAWLGYLKNSSESAIPAAIFSHVETNSLKLIGDKLMPSATAARARGQTSASPLPDGGGTHTSGKWCYPLFSYFKSVPQKKSCFVKSISLSFIYKA